MEFLKSEPSEMDEATRSKDTLALGGTFDVQPRRKARS
jgi:hypothetical protein